MDKFALLLSAALLLPVGLYASSEAQRHATPVNASVKHYLKKTRIKGDTDGRLDELSLIKSGTPYFAWALFERAQILYSTQRWDEFFGTAHYYRNFLPAGALHQKMVLLESLALVRHCQLDLAQKALSAEFSPKSEDPRFVTMTGALGMIPQLTDPSSETQDLNATPSKPDLNAKRRYWPISRAAKNMDPNALRLHIATRCKARERS